MSTRKIADDIWLVEKATARKMAYVGMIKRTDDWYLVIMSGMIQGGFSTLEEAEKFFED